MTGYNEHIKYNAPINYNGGTTPVIPPVLDGGFFPIKRKKSYRVEEETEDRRQFEQAISDIYERMHALPIEEQAEVAKIVTKSKARAPKLPPIDTLDYTAIMRSMQNVQRLIQIRDQLLEEEAVFMMLLIH